MPRAIIEFEPHSRRLSIDADKATTLNDHSRSALWHALVLAAETYDKNAVEFDKLAALDPPPAAAKSLAAQFRRQADDVRQIIALIDGDDEAEHDTAVIFVAEGMHG